MQQNYSVPNIYQDISNQSQGYFAFRFVCQHCRWQIDTMPIRSTVSVATDVMDIGVGLLGGFWGRAAEAGEQIYGTKWHSEQATALQKSWTQVQQNFHYCPKCQSTVCVRCFNLQLNLCTQCAPDLKADGAQFQHQLNIDAQHAQIQEQYHAPQFDVNAIPSAATPDMLHSSQPQLPPQITTTPPTPAAIAGFTTPGYPSAVPCPNCRRMGPPGKFCQDCGTRLPLPNLFCPKCSSPIAAGARFCQECGTNVTT